MALNITVSVQVTLKSLHSALMFPLNSILIYFVHLHMDTQQAPQNPMVLNRSMFSPFLEPALLSIPQFSKEHQVLSSGSTAQFRGFLAVASARNAPHPVFWWLIFSRLALNMQISTTISSPQGNLPDSTQFKVIPRNSVSYYKSQQSIYHCWFSYLLAYSTSPSN